MKKQALSLAVVIAGAYPAFTHALSLGDIQSNSNLNQPLRAQIELLAATPQEAQQLQVRLAPASVFNRVGVDRPAFLNQLQFNATVHNGQPIILVTSNTPITEPFVNFLLEVSWPQGQILKEYTIMLDPPVLMGPGSMAAGNEAAVRAEPRPTTGTVARPNEQQAQQHAQQLAQQQHAAQQQQRAQQLAQQQQLEQRRAQQLAQQQQHAQQLAQQQHAAQQQQRAQQQAQPTRAQAPTQQAPVQQATRTYRVRPGDTLFKVATHLSEPGANVDQMMMALYRANPHAFIDSNINGLRAGAVLNAPASGVAQAIPRAEARREVQRQYAQWRQFRSSMARTTAPQQRPQQRAATPTPAPAASPPATTEQARLEVLGGAESGQTGATNQRISELESQLALAQESLVSRERETKDLEARVEELQSTVAKQKRLIELKDSQLAELQASLSGIPRSETTQSPTPPTFTEERLEGSDIQNLMGSVGQNDSVVRAPVEEPQTQAATQAATVPIPTVRPTPVPLPESSPLDPPASPFVESPRPAGDLLSTLTSPLVWKIGLGALLALLILGYLVRLLSRGKAKKSAETVYEEPAFHPDGQSATKDTDFSELEAQLNQAESQHKAKNARPNPFEPRQESAATDTDSSFSQDEEDDVLTEANVYIAYGLHQQAESELKKALEKYPERLDYRHKLLENYFTSNDREAFDQHAEAFLNTEGASRNSSYWGDIARWGSKISPDNPLYHKQADTMNKVATGAAVATAVAATTAAASNAFTSDEADVEESFDPNWDTELDDTLSAFDLPEIQEVGEPEIPDLSEFEDSSHTEQSHETFEQETQHRDEAGLDFDIEELEQELGFSSNKSVQDEGLEDQALFFEETSDEVLAEASDLDSFEASLEEVAETVSGDELDFSLDDLELDELLNQVGANQISSEIDSELSLDTPPAGVQLDELQATAEQDTSEINHLLDDVLDLDFGELDTKTTHSDTQHEPLPDQEVLDLSLEEAFLVEDEPPSAKQTAETAQQEADNVTNLNISLNEDSGLKQILPKDSFYTAPEATSEDDSWLGDIDDALSFLDMPDDDLDLHEAHISTKLDLARAYLDMGDIDGARSTLEEVMVEGNDNQRREAETLLHQTG